MKDNILYGCHQEATDEALRDAAKNACMFDEIQESLGGFDSPVSENGNNLSGGQRQRLELASVILQSPQINISDEAASALDNTNEAVVQQNIERIFIRKNDHDNCAPADDAQGCGQDIGH